MKPTFVFFKDIKKGMKVLYSGNICLVLKVRTLKNNRKFIQMEDLDTKQFLTIQFPVDSMDYLSIF
jgi:hypothetical protein